MVVGRVSWEEDQRTGALGSEAEPVEGNWVRMKVWDAEECIMLSGNSQYTPNLVS